MCQYVAPSNVDEEDGERVGERKRYLGYLHR